MGRPRSLAHRLTVLVVLLLVTTPFFSSGYRDADFLEERNVNGRRGRGRGRGKPKGKPKGKPAAHPNCDFFFAPQVLKSDTGDHKMVAKLIGNVVTKLASNPISGREDYAFNFIARLEASINPRLCRYLMTKNNVPEIFYDRTNIERVPLKKEKGMPTVSCMLNPTQVGAPVKSFPKFTRLGALIPQTDKAAVFPLCGDLYFFRKTTLLKWDGFVEKGVIRVLECQSGDPNDQGYYEMVPVFAANCTREPPPRMYPEGGNGPGGKGKAKAKAKGATRR